MMGLVARDILSSLNMVLVSFVRNYPSALRGMIVVLMMSSLRPRVHADVVIVTLNDNLVSAATVTLVMPMSVVIVVVVVSMIVMPWIW